MNDIVKALHVGISVYNMDESIAWYEKNLGFELESNEYIPQLKAKVAFIRYGDFEIELFEYDEPKELPVDRLEPNTDLQTVGTKHVAFEVKDVAGLKAKLVANGVEIAHEATMVGNSVLFIRDNSGVLIEFIQFN